LWVLSKTTGSNGWSYFILTAAAAAIVADWLVADVIIVGVGASSKIFLACCKFYMVHLSW
jgi:hypothetical protein